MNRFILWIRALRAPFFQAAAIPVILGTAVAFYFTGKFSFLLFFLALIANVSLNAAINLTNDYYDRPTDDFNPQPTPFSGGSRIIQEKLLPAKKILKAAFIAYAIAALIGIYLILHCGLTLLYIVIIGFFLNYFYTAPPLRLSYHGLGELTVFLCLGPLAVLGAYYVQTSSLAWEAILASLPVGFLVAGILYINEFPDYEPDKNARKNHLIILLGREKARFGYVFVLFLIYFSLFLAVGVKAAPFLALICLITLPLAVKSAKTAWRYYADIQGIIPAMAGTIQLHLIIGLILSLAYVLGRIFAV